MLSKRMLVIWAMIVLAVSGVVRAQSDAKQQLFIGSVATTPDAYVGMLVDGEDILLYICDGNAETDTVTVAQWFSGTISDGEIDITAPNGALVQAKLLEGSLIGKFTLADGSIKDFDIGEAKEGAALFRTEFTLGEDRFVGGWLVLEDGSVRGAILKVGSGELVPASLSGSWPWANPGDPE